VCVLARGFSWQHRITEFASIGYASPLTLCDIRICLDVVLRACPSVTTDWYGYLPASPHRLTTSPRPPFPEGIGRTGFGRLVPVIRHWALTHGYGNINPLSIDYACRPRLRSRLTLGGLACPRNPWSFGGQGSHLPYRTRWLHRMQDAPLPNAYALPRLRRCA